MAIEQLDERFDRLAGVAHQIRGIPFNFQRRRFIRVMFENPLGFGQRLSRPSSHQVRAGQQHATGH